MNIQKMMKEMQKMQGKLSKAQQDLENEFYEAEAGGGMVKVKLSGRGIFESIQIKKEAVDPEDVEALEDLLVAAVNQALTKKEDSSKSMMSGLTNGMKIPGLM